MQRDLPFAVCGIRARVTQRMHRHPTWWPMGVRSSRPASHSAPALAPAFRELFSALRQGTLMVTHTIVEH